MIKNLDFQLNNEGIARITEKIESWLKEQKVNNKNRIRFVFTMEDVLKDIANFYGETKEVSLSFVKGLGHSYIKLTFAGEKYDLPEREAKDEYTQILAQNVGLEPSHSYKNGNNIITLEIPKDKTREEVFFILAVALALIMGAAKTYLPEKLAFILHDYILGNIEAIFMNLLCIFAGILIFLSILSGICGMGSIANLNKKGRYLISKTMLTGFLETGIITVLLLPFFTFHYGKTDGGSGFSEIIALFLNSVPSNPISPFQDGNMLQIAFIALIIGALITVTGSKVSGIKDLVCQGNVLFINIVNAICKLLPIYIFSALTLLFWDNGFGGILNIWKPIVLCLGFNVVLVLIKTIIVSIRFKVKFSLLIKKILPTIGIGFATCSSMAAFGTVLEINEKKLGVSPEYNSFAVPLKNILQLSCSASAFVITIFYFTELYNTNINTAWIIGVWLVVCIVQPAIPPVSGGMVICLGLIMKQFGIPDTNLGLAATLTLILDFITTATRIASNHMEVVEEAGHFKMLNRDILTK